MSLLKTRVATLARRAANRRNAQKSTGPQTARGKAWSCRNHLKTGGDSPQYRNFLHTLMNAPPGRMGLVAEALLRAQEVRHPLFVQMAELAVRTEADLCREARLRW